MRYVYSDAPRRGDEMTALRMNARPRVTYSNLLKIALAVGFFNLFAIAIRSQVSGNAAARAHWYVLSLIVAFPVAILCAWLISKTQRNWR